jgi:peptidyl-prolyl cis-trans isomerase A (cyclophilin A)
MSAMDVTLHTNKGDINITLFPDQAPETVRNFVGLADGTKEWKDAQTGETKTEPFYDGLTFHRIIPGFMVQGGCPRGDASRVAEAPTARSSSSPSRRPAG